MTSEISSFVTAVTLDHALRRLFATADHLLKIWFTLKQMGMAEAHSPVVITTSSPNEALTRLFSFGSPKNELFVPFAHTTRFMKMNEDAGRSIIQTTIRRWNTSGSVVTCDPTGFLDIQTNSQEQLIVGPTRTYPIGLGIGSNGFSLKSDQRVTIPILSFAVWYYRQTALPNSLTEDALNSYLIKRLCTDLNISPAEREAVFVEDNFELKTDVSQLSDSDIYRVCSEFMEHPSQPITAVFKEDFSQHSHRIRSMKTINDKPSWLNQSPSDVLKGLLEQGAKAILLYGPPRTGKTRAIDQWASRGSEIRTTIQIHDGWGYDNLIQGFRPNSSGEWGWESGPLKKAIEGGKKLIVLEEINRTNLTQALGEVFSLIEDSYRGEHNQITLRSGESFFIPEDVVFAMTMNTLDKSTEDIDDAMMGRFAAIEYPPRVEDVAQMLQERGLPIVTAAKLREIFVFIQDYYPLGQGYFVGINENTNILEYYLTRLRPVLANHFRDYKPENLALIDNKVDTLFADKP